MKKAIAFLVMLLMTCSVAWTATSDGVVKQSVKTSGTNLSAGIKAGVSLANLSGDDIEGVNAKVGLAAGAFVGFGLGPIVIQPEILYVQKGAQDENNSDLKMKLDYLEIPLLIKAYFMGPQEKVRPCVYVGPALGILLSAKADNGTDSVDVKDGYKSTDLGVAIGAGVDIQGFVIDARYTMGLTKIPDTGDSDIDVDVKNSAFMVFVGYSFI